MGNDIENVIGSNYWAAYVGGEKIETDRLKRHTRMTYFSFKDTYFFSLWDFEKLNKLIAYLAL